MGEVFCPECSDHPPMTRLGVGGSTRYYLCTACGLIRADRYSGNGISGQVWHASPDALSSDVAREEAERVLRIVRTEQLELF